MVKKASFPQQQETLRAYGTLLSTVLKDTRSAYCCINLTLRTLHPVISLFSQVNRKSESENFHDCERTQHSDFSCAKSDLRRLVYFLCFSLGQSAARNAQLLEVITSKVSCSRISYLNPLFHKQYSTSFFGFTLVRSSLYHLVRLPHQVHNFGQGNMFVSGNPEK